MAKNKFSTAFLETWLKSHGRRPEHEFHEWTNRNNDGFLEHESKAFMMKYNPINGNRCSIRLTRYDYSQRGGYFITICTHDREYLFGDIVHGEMRLNQFGRIVEEEWSGEKDFDAIREYIINNPLQWQYDNENLM